MKWLSASGKSLSLFIYFSCLSFPIFSQNVGIGTTSPKAGLHIINNNGILATGVYASGATLVEAGAGTRLIWYPKKAAFRAGSISGTHSTWWDDASIGQYSVALGLDNRAWGNNSLALGSESQATSVSSIAIGNLMEATGAYSMAIGGSSSSAKEATSVVIGSFSKANSYSAFAIGRSVNAGYSSQSGEQAFAIGNGDASEFNQNGHYATGVRSFAIGNLCHAVGNGSFAIGNGSVAGAQFDNSFVGLNSYAFGNSCRATGNYSFAFGNNANTNGHIGSVVIAGRTDGVTVATGLDHHMLMQFQGGYHLQTNLAASMGVYLQPGGNAWLSFCDSTKKENMLPMNDEEVLQKVSRINYYSWKYKDEPDPQRRNYGVMAQDFYTAFGHDGLGTIGNDTLVNPIDMLGIAFSAIKALEKRTEKLEDVEKENALLKKQLVQISNELEIVKRKR